MNFTKYIHREVFFKIQILPKYENSEIFNIMDNILSRKKVLNNQLHTYVLQCLPVTTVNLTPVYRAQIVLLFYFPAVLFLQLFIVYLLMYLLLYFLFL